MPRLRTLVIGDYDAQTSTVAALVANPTLAIESLYFYGDSYADLAEGLPLLAASDKAHRLRHLALVNCGLFDAQCDTFVNLEMLELSGGSNTTNRLRDTGLAAIARAPLGKLRRLALDHNEIGSIEPLFEPSALPSLRELALNAATIDDAAVERLVGCRPFTGLYLGGCSQLTNRSLIAIATSPFATELRGLNLAGTAIDGEGIRALNGSPLVDLEYIGVTKQLVALLAPRFAAVAA